MGPTNVALVKLFQAESQLREAQGRLDAVTKGVRIQDRKVHDLSEKLRLAQSQLKENQSHAGTVEVDLKSRDAHIEKLRTQQQNAKTNKEYQTFLIEINTQKVDKGKIEEELLKLMEAVEKGQADVKEMSAVLEAEQTKLAGMKAQINDQTAALTEEIDSLKATRQQVAAAVPAKARELFDRLADRLEGEALSALSKPDRRREEYVCTACNMDLVVDVYNKLHTRDDLVFCPSCRRILYIPEDLPPETAVHKKKPSKVKAAPEVGAAAPRQQSAVDVLNSLQPEPDPEPETQIEPSSEEPPTASN